MIFFFFKFHHAADDDAIKGLALNNSSLLLDCGYVKPVSMIKLKDKSDLVHTITLHKVLLGVLGEMNQFKNGIESAGLGVFESIEKYHDLCASFYCWDNDSKLTSGVIQYMQYLFFVP